MMTGGKEMTTMDAADVREDIGKLLDTAAGEPVIIESAGKPRAVVVSLETYRRRPAAPAVRLRTLSAVRRRRERQRPTRRVGG
jgi:prevent-host-death family protein